MSYDYIYSIIIYPLIYILPAYVANGAPVIFGGGAPIDLDKKFRDKPIFGRHKTIRGLAAGLAAGFLIGIIESFFFSYMLFIGIFLSIGTHFGDLLGSFVKRRLGKGEGEKFGVFDQYLFLFFAFAFAFNLDHLPDIYGILFIIVLTGILHRLTNIGAHRFKIKKVPW